MPVEREARRSGRGVHGGGADGPRAAGAVAPREGAEELDGHLGLGPGPRLLVVGGRVDVEYRVQVRVERRQHPVLPQRVIIQTRHNALLEEEGGPQPVLLDQSFGGLRERDAVRGCQGLPVAARYRQRDVRAFPLGQDAKHPPDEGRVQERHVGGADERGIGAPAERGEPGGDPLHRALALPGVVDHHGALRQIRQILAVGPHHDDRPLGRARHDADRPAQQRRPVPLQRRLRRAHPRGPAAGQHHTRGTRHFFMVCITRPGATVRSAAGSPLKMSGRRVRPPDRKPRRPRSPGTPNSG